jgi:PKD repeat protein
LAQWGEYGTGDGQLNSPSGIAIDLNGTVYVADTPNNCIQKFSHVIQPVANFTVDVTLGTAPMTVKFTDLSLNNPIGWTWYFGDETYAVPWTQMTASAGWSGRAYHTSVAMPDGSIVLMGGTDKSSSKNDTWRSTDNGATWTQVNTGSGWSPRMSHCSVAMPDGSIVLMGGLTSDGYTNDEVWKSIDDGTTWTRVTASPGWSARRDFSCVAMPDGSIVLMGGEIDGGGLKNDTWRSTDNGATWTQMNVNAGWTARTEQNSVAMPDGSIVLMGGVGNSNSILNDTWGSTNNGATWTQLNASSGWTTRYAHSSVVMPDGSIVLTGGENNLEGSLKNDTWRSTNNGVTWTQITVSPGWSSRFEHTSVAMPDGSIVLMGGSGVTYDSLKNDVWRFMPARSSAQNPSHTYTTPGNYVVAMQAYNAGGYNSMRKTGYITVTNAMSKTGVYRPGVGFYLKMDNGSTWIPSTDKYLAWDNAAGDLPIAGDWNMDGRSETGVYRPGVGFYLKKDNGSTWTPSTDKYLAWDNAAGDLPIAGDWNADGRTETGVYRPGVGFYLKMDNGSTWNPSTDMYLAWDNAAIDRPIAGDWNMDGRTETGVYRPGVGFYLKMDNGSSWTPSTDVYLAWDNAALDRPVAGDWNADGRTETGVYRPGVGFYLKWDNESTWNPSTDKYLAWDNAAGDLPIAGNFV